MKILVENNNLLKTLMYGVQSIPEDVYTYKPYFSDSSSGAHVRHILDHYDCFLCGYENNQAINYDQRKRNVLMETDTRAVVDCIDQLIIRLAHINQNRDIQSMMTISEPETFCSNIEFELRFLYNHTLHHMALIKYILTEKKYELAKHFGVSKSTLQYQASLCAH